MIEIILCVYVVFFVFNFGTAFAYLQRRGLTKNGNQVTNCTRALITSLPGFFGTICILIYCHFPKYGWTLDYLKPNSITKGKGTYRSIWN